VLPAGPQTLLLAAACEPTGEPRVVLEAARRLGVPAEAADVVQAARLITVFPQVVFRHPLVRSAVYGGASPAERRRAHLALADTWAAQRAMTCGHGIGSRRDRAG
jgi:hypothetical protein